MIRELKISDFTEVITGGTPSTAIREYWEGGSIPWLNSGELNNIYIYESKNFITELGLKNSSTRLMPPDTVLIALTGATTGLSAITKIEACANQSVTGILPSKNHSSNYLLHYLRTQRERILDKAWGNAQPHISQQFVKDLMIPVPILQDQIQIANILSKAETLIEQRKQSIALLDDFLKSTFLEMFGTPSSNKKKFLKGTIRDIAIEVKYGTSKPAEAEGKYPYLRMNNITTDGYWDLSKMKFINIEAAEKEKCSVKKGDLIFNRTNSKELVGKSAVFNLDEEMIIAGYLIRVRLSEKANPYFVWGYLNSLHGKQTLLGMCNSIVGMANINAQELQEIKILMPPIELQTQFANIVTKIEALKEQYKKSLQELENLYGTLSQRAFKGELFNESQTSPKVIPFERKVLAGWIIQMSNDRQNFGVTLFQKNLHVCEYFAEVEYETNYSQNRAGPDDRQFMKAFQEEMVEKKWFKQEQKFKLNKFVPDENAGKLVNKYGEYFKPKSRKISFVLGLLKDKNLDDTELISTLYAVWNNRIIRKETVNAELLTNDVFSWSEEKGKYTRAEIKLMYEWMKKKGLVPVGFGKEIMKQ